MDCIVVKVRQNGSVINKAGYQYRRPERVAGHVAGLKGFPDAINSVYPQTYLQLFIIHRAHWENLNTFFGYPQGYLHHECYRIAEQRDPCRH